MVIVNTKYVQSAVYLAVKLYIMIFSYISKRIFISLLNEKFVNTNYNNSKFKCLNYSREFSWIYKRRIIAKESERKDRRNKGRCFRLNGLQFHDSSNPAHGTQRWIYRLRRNKLQDKCMVQRPHAEESTRCSQHRSVARYYRFLSTCVYLLSHQDRSTARL